MRKILLGMVLILSACSGGNESPEILGLNVEDVTGITIVRFDEQLILEREDGAWRVVEPVQTAANPVTIENLLMTVDKMAVESRVSSEPGDMSQYGVDDNAPVITLTTPSRDYTIHAGRPGRDFNKQHVRFDDEPQIYLVNGRLNTTLRVDVWQERIVVDLEPGNIEGATFYIPSGEMQLERSGEGWTLTDSTGTHEVTAERVEKWAAFFNPLRTDRFAQVPREIVIENAGRSIEFELAGGEGLRIYFLDLEGEVAVVTSGSDIVFQIFGLRMNNFFPDLLSFY